MKSFTVAEIAAQVRGEVLGDGATRITGLTSADRASAGDLTFAENEKYFTAAESSGASAVLVTGASASGKTLIKVANVRNANVRPSLNPSPNAARR